MRGTRERGGGRGAGPPRHAVQVGSGAAFRTGARDGVRVRKGALVLDGPGSHRSYRGKRYDVGTWTSPVVSPGYGVTQLVASWSAVTPKNSWVEVRVRV